MCNLKKEYHYETPSGGSRTSLPKHTGLPEMVRTRVTKGGWMIVG